MKLISTLRLGGRLLELRRPQVMGILNVTPDSFFSGSRCFSREEIGLKAQVMVRDGVDIFDIGACSSRPGADDVSGEEEWRRLSEALEVVREKCPDIPVSVDTFRTEVARKCIDRFGVEIINDISGGTLDEGMWQLVAEKRVAYVLMHMRGNPATMQSLTGYDDVVAEVLTDLLRKAAELRQLGVADVILDPGFGFAKSIEQNYRLLANLQEFVKTGMPVLAGMSRKSMLYKALEISPEEALEATVAADMAALMKGAAILRVHDVKAAAQQVKIFQLISENKY